MMPEMELEEPEPPEEVSPTVAAEVRRIVDIVAMTVAVDAHSHIIEEMEAMQTGCFEEEILREHMQPQKGKGAKHQKKQKKTADLRQRVHKARILARQKRLAASKAEAAQATAASTVVSLQGHRGLVPHHGDEVIMEQDTMERLQRAALSVQPRVFSHSPQFEARRKEQLRTISTHVQSVLSPRLSTQGQVVSSRNGVPYATDRRMTQLRRAFSQRVTALRPPVEQRAVERRQRQRQQGASSDKQIKEELQFIKHIDIGQHDISRLPAWAQQSLELDTRQGVVANHPPPASAVGGQQVRVLLGSSVNDSTAASGGNSGDGSRQAGPGENVELALYGDSGGSSSSACGKAPHTGPTDGLSTGSTVTTTNSKNMGWTGAALDAEHAVNSPHTLSISSLDLKPTPPAEKDGSRPARRQQPKPPSAGRRKQKQKQKQYKEKREKKEKKEKTKEQNELAAVPHEDDDPALNTRSHQLVSLLLGRAAADAASAAAKECVPITGAPPAANRTMLAKEASSRVVDGGPRGEWERETLLQRGLVVRMKDIEMLQATTQSRERTKKKKLKPTSQRLDEAVAKSIDRENSHGSGDGGRTTGGRGKVQVSASSLRIHARAHARALHGPSFTSSSGVCGKHLFFFAPFVTQSRPFYQDRPGMKYRNS
jgi:hypothetical protein